MSNQTNSDVADWVKPVAIASIVFAIVGFFIPVFGPVILTPLAIVLCCLAFYGGDFKNLALTAAIITFASQLSSPSFWVYLDEVLSALGLIKREIPGWQRQLGVKNTNTFEGVHAFWSLILIISFAGWLYMLALFLGIAPRNGAKKNKTLSSRSPQPRRRQNSSIADFSLPQISLPNFPNLSQSSRKLALVIVVGLALAGGIWRLHSLGYLDFSSKSTTPSVSSQSNAEICSNALDGSKTGWDRNDSYSWAIKEALARRLSIADCRVLLGLPRDITSTTQTNVPPAIQQQRVTLLDRVTASNWAVGGHQNCTVANRVYSASVNGNVIRWQDGTGRVFLESITYSGENGFGTETIQSPSHPRGTTWQYTWSAAGQMYVRSAGARGISEFVVVPCN